MPYYTFGSSTTLLFIPNEARKRVKIIFIHSLIELSLVFKENICLRQMNNMHSLQNIQASLIYFARFFVHSQKIMQKQLL